MSEALRFPVDDAEADAIDVIAAELSSAETRGDEAAIRSFRDKLSEARMKKVDRLTNETWDALEKLVGYRLRR